MQNIALYYIALQINRVQLNAIQYNVATLSAVCHHAVPCNAMQCCQCGAKQTQLGIFLLTGTTQEQLAQIRTVLETFDKQN